MASLLGANPLVHVSLVEAGVGSPAPAQRLGLVRFGGSRLDAGCVSLGLSVGNGERSSSLAPIRGVNETRTAYINGKADSVQGNYITCPAFSAVLLFEQATASSLRIMSRN